MSMRNYSERPSRPSAAWTSICAMNARLAPSFSYSYLNSRITSALNGIRKFIDEFITRIAEAYPSKD